MAKLNNEAIKLSNVFDVLSKHRNTNTNYATEPNDTFIVDKGSLMFYHDLFHSLFLDRSSINEDKDDLLFFVSKSIVKHQEGFTVKSNLLVFRRDNDKIPNSQDHDIDWEETLYLNVILQKFKYELVCAVSQRDENGKNKILRYTVNEVFPSPSTHRMDKKAQEEVLSYPDIYFTINNYDEAFKSSYLTDYQDLCVELVASSAIEGYKSVIFVGAVSYNAIKKVFEQKTNLSTRLTGMLPWSGASSRLDEQFINLRGPHRCGRAQIAVTQTASDSIKNRQKSDDPTHSKPQLVRSKSSDSWLPWKNSEPLVLNAHLTFISVSWYYIIQSIFDNPKKPQIVKSL